MKRGAYIELVRRQIYGGQPPEEAEITVSLVNYWLNQAVGYAAQKCYSNNLRLEGIAFVNGGFYTTFKGLAITKDENFLWKVELPEIPPGIGYNEGISTVVFKSDLGEISYPVVLMNQNQASISKGMRPIPNKLVGHQEGKNVYVLSTVNLTQYTATATIISGGVSTDLNTELNVPPDYLVDVTEYLKQQLSFERAQLQDVTPDGIDGGKTT